MSITELAVRNYRFVIVGAIALLAVGILGYMQMPRQEDPTMPSYVGVATVVYPGASVDEVEDRILDPLEEAIQDLEEIAEIRGTAQDGVGVVVGEFREDVDTEDAYDLFVQRVTAAKSLLPDGVVEVRLRSEKPSNVVAFQYVIHGEGFDAPTLRDWAEELESRLRVLDDAKNVKVEGIPEREVHVRVRPDALATLGLSLTQVSDLVAAANGNIPGGVVHGSDRRLSVRPNARFETIEDIRATVLTSIDGRPVRLDDVADVGWGVADATYLTRHLDEEAALVVMSLKEGRNIFHLSRAAAVEIEAFREKLPEGLTLSTAVNQAESVKYNLYTFGSNLISGGVIIVLLVALVAGLRPAIVVVTALALALGISFGLLHGFGIALQQMSIAGLVTVLGLLVDNAIVVVEGIVDARHRGLSAIKAAIQGTDRVGSAVASSTATTVAAFVPMLRMEGSVGAFTRDIPIVVVTVLIVSLGVALVGTPLVAARVFRSEESAKLSGLSPWIDRVIVRGLYPRFLRLLIRRPWAIVIGATLGVVVSAAFASLLGFNFFPAAEKRIFSVKVQAPVGTSLERTSELSREVAGYLRERDVIVSVTENLGKGNPKIYYNHIRDAEQPHFAELLVNVTPDGRRQVKDLVREVRNAFANHPDMVVLSAPLMQGPPIGAPVSVQLTGPDLARLSEHATTLEAALRKVPGAVNVVNDLRTGSPRLDLRVDPVKAARAGLNPGVVAREVRTALAGNTATTLRMDDEDIDVVVRVAPEGDESFDDLGRIRLSVATPTGAVAVPLGELITPVLSPSYAAINHTDLKRSVIVGSDVDGRLAPDVLADLMPAVESLDLAPDESFKIIGEDEERDRAFLSMLTNVVVAIGLIYGILVLQFRSFKQPFVVFSALPVALAGSVFGLLVGGWPFGFTAFIGLLALTGIVVNDAIVLIDQINQKRRAGLPLTEAVNVGAASRFQPVFLTTATTIAGLMPLSLSGSSMWGPMGWVIMGGLAAATVVTLGLVPALYVIIERRSEGAPLPARRSVGRVAATAALVVFVLPAPATALELRDVLDRVPVESADVSVARYGVDEAREAAAGVRSSRLPRLSASAEWATTDETGSVFGVALSRGDNPFDVDLDEPIDVFRGRLAGEWVLWDRGRGSRVRAADTATHAAEHAVRATEMGSRLMAVEGYFALVRAEEERNVLAAARRQVQAELDDASARLRVGRGLEADVRGLEARLAAITADEAAVDGRIASIGARLRELVPSLSVDAANPNASVLATEFATLAEAEQHALMHRPTLAARAAALDAERAGIGAASGELFPKLIARATYDALVPERDLDRESRSYSASVGVEWTLFAGGEIRAAKREATARRDMADAERTAAERRVLREVTEQWAARDTARRRLAAANKGAVAAAEAFRIVSLRYREGRDRLSRLLDAELALTDSRTEEVRAKTALEIAEAGLSWATGSAVEAG